MFDWIQTNVPPFLWIALVAFGAIMGTVAYLILLERKVAAWVQDRPGPNRVGPLGLLQPLADGLKFFFKEDYRPAGVDKILFTVAPSLMIIVMIVSSAVIPWGGIKQSTRVVNIQATTPDAAARQVLPLGATLISIEPAADKTTALVTYQYPFQVARLNIGVLFIIAVLSLGVYGIVLGGWASNNKYSFLGGLRATAQMISYEIPLGLSLLAVVIMFGTLDLTDIVDKQAHYWVGYVPAWNVFTQPLAFIIFLICIHAEANRAPFDLAEAEQELVGGYHTEYSSMRFALFFLSEYAGMITTSAVCVALFFGGWHIWGVNGPDPLHPSVTDSFWIILIRCGVFFVKTLAIIFIFMWVRWSLPRFRFDQLMMVAWRGLIPISLALLMGTAVVVYFAGQNSEQFRDPQKRWVDGRVALLFLAMNIVLVVLAMIVSRLLPAAPATNRRLVVEGSRFEKTPVPATN